MNILQKINWKLRKVHITILPLVIYVNSNWEGWGFDILNIQYGLSEYSLLKLNWTLPNGADKKLNFRGDFLFLRTPLFKMLLNLDDRILWSKNVSKLDEFKFWMLNLLFK